MKVCGVYAQGPRGDHTHFACQIRGDGTSYWWNEKRQTDGVGNEARCEQRDTRCEYQSALNKSGARPFATCHGALQPREHCHSLALGEASSNQRGHADDGQRCPGAKQPANFDDDVDFDGRNRKEEECQQATHSLGLPRRPRTYHQHPEPERLMPAHNTLAIPRARVAMTDRLAT